MQALYKKEGVSMTGGCLWALLPLLVLLPLYSVVREPIMYLLHESFDTTCVIMNTVKDAMPELVNGRNAFYEQMLAAPLLPQFAEQLKDVVGHPETLEGLNFMFAGVDLAAVPEFAFWRWDSWSWANIGSFLLPVLSAGSQVASVLISTKMNNTLITDKNGVQDKEAAKNSQTNASNKVMMVIMPFMSLFIGFTIPAALSLYWLVQGVANTVGDVYLNFKYRKVYDAEDAERMRKAIEAERAEMEKERIRAERRAANPDGITTNTSKKKLQQKQQKEQAAARAAALREYAQKHGITLEEAEKEHKDKPIVPASRPYSRGRAYDPNRYGSSDTEE